METLYEVSLNDSITGIEDIGAYENNGDRFISIETTTGIIDIPQDISIRIAKAVLGIKE